MESYVLEIDGLDSSKSVVSVLDDLANFEKDLTKEILKTSRQALVRFPRARHVSYLLFRLIITFQSL